MATKKYQREYQRNYSARLRENGEIVQLTLRPNDLALIIGAMQVQVTQLTEQVEKVPQDQVILEQSRRMLERLEKML